ncbi:MAG: hypothetical protein DHS20C01_26210 [marine bacterium B5-7]|nr:MAG: hypothetical protein DHS20C01_26210 [marine bacterium B5-7]
MTVASTALHVAGSDVLDKGMDCMRFFLEVEFRVDIHGHGWPGAASGHEWQVLPISRQPDYESPFICYKVI